MDYKKEWRNHPRYKTRALAEEAGHDLVNLNAIGRGIGLSSCRICGDSWMWKTMHRLYITRDRGSSPYCEECAAGSAIEYKDMAIDALCAVWAEETEPEELERERAAMKKAAREGATAQQGGSHAV